MAKAVHDIEVPEESDTNAQEPHNAGELTVKLSPQLRDGQPAPALEIKTLDGATVRLEELRGKVVLLWFWATWSQLCAEQIPTLKAIHDEFGQNTNFAMVGLSLDKTDEKLRTFVRQREMNWAQGRLGDWSQTTLPSQYSVTFIPALYLVGPDGKVLSRGLRGPQVREGVIEALSAVED